MTDKTQVRYVNGGAHAPSQAQAQPQLLGFPLLRARAVACPCPRVGLTRTVLCYKFTSQRPTGQVWREGHGEGLIGNKAGGGFGFDVPRRNPIQSLVTCNEAYTVYEGKNPIVVRA
jgi:hypothetical protein